MTVPDDVTKEPRSIHTWFEWPDAHTYGCVVDVNISRFPQVSPTWLYFFALQASFSFNEAAHGGFQWAGINRYRNSADKGVNWGGYPDLGVNLFPFEWQAGEWYSYRIHRLGETSAHIWCWQFDVFHHDSGVVWPFGTIQTRSPWITGACVFTETGYGVTCDAHSVRVDWANPRFRSLQGEQSPRGLIATYNGTCDEPHSTGQEMVSTLPLRWYHETNTRRAVPQEGKLWSR